MGAGWLSASEQARLETLRQPARREEFIACRYALRQLLAGRDAQIPLWQLDAVAGAAPTVLSRPLGAEGQSWQLSLSHSGIYVACAASSRAVGVDLELLSPRHLRSPWEEVAALVCSPSERQSLQSQGGCSMQRRAALLRCWSVKEAFFKCVETGVDFAQLPRISCHPWADCVAAPQAYARTWEGHTATGQALVLSVCMLQPVGECALHMDADVRWRAITDWGLQVA